MSMLKEEDKKALRERFSSLTGKVKLINFTQELECDYCRETRELLRDISELSDKIDLETYNFISDAEKTKEYNIDKIPALAVVGKQDYGIRFYGIPAGYEFVSLLQAIEMVSSDNNGLSKETLDKVQTITTPVHLQVFVTPTCPYCPNAVIFAHQLAMANSNITSDMVEATEFPHLANKYNVRGVPRVVINEENHFEGALPEGLYMRHILDALEPRINQQ